MSFNYTFINYLSKVLANILNAEISAKIQNYYNIHNDLGHADLV